MGRRTPHRHPAGHDRRGPAPWRRIRAGRSRSRSFTSAPARRRSSAAPGAHLHRRPGPIHGQRRAGQVLRRPGLSPRGPALPDPRGSVRVDQGSGQEGDGHQAAPRRADPRQGDRGRDRPAAGRGQRAVHYPVRNGDDWSRAGRRSWPARTTARSRSPSRPARDTCSSLARPPTISSKRSAAGCSTTASPAASATMPTTSSPTRSRPATGRTRSSPCFGPARPSRAAWSDRRADGRRRRDPQPLHFEPFNLNLARRLTSPCPRRPFELHGLDPEKATRVSFLDADHQWGATVELSGKQAGEELRSSSSRAARQRRGSSGPTASRSRRSSRPFRNPRQRPARPVGPGQDAAGDARGRRGLPASTSIASTTGTARFTDADGRITLPCLIPGALPDQRLVDQDVKGVQVRKDFTVKPGETLDLGDILIEKPQP